ncbi:glycerol-3-phosphate dehydrogenase/oxidase [Leadbetterella sp. DM7]|uniref:glycerol-3-phosphate dehydrogenase/oxidase n=1 Tax=Leadbetterella sp. DM7 TaxID=3235085 RepID=UPI00349EB0DB
MNRGHSLSRLSHEKFDICIIGAGASGAGVALDAALRGYKVALIDGGDFCGQTSSKSTKLIHGGVRYLEQAFKNFDFGQLKQVKHGLRERKYLYSNARYITKKLGIITPVFSAFEGFYYFIGLKLYGFFALKDHFPSARWLTRKEMLTESPHITAKAHSGVLYYDGQLDDARYVMALVKTAYREGAAAANYCRLTGFEKEAGGKLSAARVEDVLSGETFTLQSTLFINCTGPFSDTIRLMANPAEERRIAPSKGVHVMLPGKYFEGDKAMLIPKTSDGRLIFVIPFRGKVMIGTTDTPYKGGNEEPRLEKEEAAYLLETARPYLKDVPGMHEVKAGFGGVRPLLLARRRSEENTKSLLRDHEVEVDEESGLVSLLGGKWTTYRLMAQDTMDAVDTLFGKKNICRTHDYKLVGNDEEISQPADQEDLLWQRLLSYYGCLAPEVLAIDGRKEERLHPAQPYLAAEVIFACRHEMAQTVRDFMARRVRWEILDWQSCFESVEKVGEIMAAELGWSVERKEREIREYGEMLQQWMIVPGN